MQKNNWRFQFDNFLCLNSNFIRFLIKLLSAKILLFIKKKYLGQYTCIANSNEQAEKSDVDFFVTGVKGGFEIR